MLNSPSLALHGLWIEFQYFTLKIIIKILA